MGGVPNRSWGACRTGARLDWDIPTLPLTERLRLWGRQTVLFWRETASPTDFVRLMRVRLANSKVGWLACPRPITAKVRVPVLGGDIWLRSHTSDVGVLCEQLAGHAYRALEDHDADVRTIVDLGANTGLVARWLLARYPKARIVCVEPEPGNVDMLRRNLARFNGRAAIVPHCVGAIERTTRLESSTGEWGYAMTGDSGDVEVTTMDRLVRNHDLDRIDVLKCDIEGAEREVFGDCAGWIDRVGFAVVECHGFQGEELLAPGWRLVERHGWAAYDVETVALSPQ